MDFSKYKEKQWHDGRMVYRGLFLKEIVEMGFENYYYYLTKLQKRKLSYSDVKKKYEGYLSL